MKTLGASALLLISLPAFASTYTITAPHLTMHVGDAVPPLLFNVSDYSGLYSSHFSGEPSLSTSATSASPVGNYPIVLSQGAFKLTSADDSLQLISGILTVIPADPIGARLNNVVSFPPGFFDGPPGHSVLNVIHNSIANLVGDCVTDNAVALALLLSQNGLRTSTTTNGGPTPINLFFPPGCYATSQPVTIYGNTWALWGSGPQRSYIRLLPNSAAFNTGKPTQFFSPQSVVGNQNFREFIYNLGFNIGAGNPDAIPFTTDQNNVGAVRNVQIWADDSNCPYAINFRRAYPGPVLFKDVAVYGCRMAYSSNQNEYNVTFENFTTEGQTEIVLDNRSIKASIRHWLSDNSVEALHVYGSGANVAILDSEILNGGSGATGIAVDKGCAAYVKNLVASGYSPTETDSGTGTAVPYKGNIQQAWTGSAQSLFDRTQTPDTLHLAVEETPTPNDPPASQWSELSGNVAFWPAEIVHSKSPTVYAPPGIYSPTSLTQVTVPDSINHIEFYQSKFPHGIPPLVLTVAGSSRTPLTIDGCPYEACQIMHTGSRPIVIRDSTLYSYTAQNGSGDVYIEDSILSDGAGASIPVNFYPSQHIWGRQFNQEQKLATKLICTGCKLWILGYKTEQATPSMVLSDHAQAEIFGFFFYQNQPPNGPGTASIYSTNSSLFATGWSKIDQPGRGQTNWVIETRGAATLPLPTQDVNTSQQLNMFYSYGAGKLSKN